MRRLARVFLVAALPAFAGVPAAHAQASRPGAEPSHAQIERKAVELRQGMTLEEVRKLLGKPKRTSLRNASSSTVEAWQGTLQWTYAWSSERTLHIVFAAKAPEQWYVNSWDWSDY